MQRPARLWVDAAVGFGVLTAIIVRSSTAERYDMEVARSALRHRHRALVHVADAVSVLGRPAVVVASLLIASLILAWQRRVSRAIVILLTFAVTLVLGELLRRHFGRSSPTHVAGFFHPGARGYPSGHVLGSCLASAALAEATGRRAAWWAVGIITVAVGICRVYLFAHFPADVLAGALLGAAAIGAAQTAADYAENRAKDMRPDLVTD